MPRDTFLPHKNKPETMPMEIDPPEDGLDIENETLPLYLSDSCSFDLKVHGEFEPDFLTELLPDFERDSQPFDIYLTLESNPIPGLKAYKMEKTGTGYKGTVPLNKDTWFGTVKLRTVATRNNQTAPTENYASEIGSLLASSKTILVYIDKPKSPPGTSLDIDWANFIEDFPEYRDEYSCLDTSGTTPKIWLNSSIPELQATLQSQATTGNKKMIKDIIMGEIAVGHWITLITLSLMKLKSNDGGPLDEDMWEQGVLKKWRMYLCPNAANTDEADRLLKTAVSDDEPDELNILLLKLEKVVISRMKRTSPKSHYRRLEKINVVLEQNNG